MNRLARARFPFVFLWDFESKKPVVFEREKAAENGLFFEMEGRGNSPAMPRPRKNFFFRSQPMPKADYAAAFAKVQAGLRRGDSYLTNLTFPTPIETNFSLQELFGASRARFKVLYRDQFTCFSPEPFVRITANEIATYPMKGTIDAALPQAAERILNDPKEAAEHATIVDLLRNDLSRVAKAVRVRRYRYLEALQTHESRLLQVSSEVVGTIDTDFWNQLGDHFLTLLPAGSISGAPKVKTCELIRKAEQQERGYFTGVFGYYDGKTLQSAVMIRFIEQRNGRLYFRSGGGITANSQCGKEYEEMIQKVYVPIY